jgi:hypothetical protein
MNFPALQIRCGSRKKGFKAGYIGSIEYAIWPRCGRSPPEEVKWIDAQLRVAPGRVYGDGQELVPGFLIRPRRKSRILFLTLGGIPSAQIERVTEAVFL